MVKNMKKLSHFILDKKLVLFLFLFMIISMATIYSAMTYLPDYLGNLALKQGFWYIVGAIFIFLIIKFGNEMIYKSAYFLYFANVLLLILLLIIGTPVNGSKCWFIIPGIGTFQPSEFMKISYILLISVVTAKFVKNYPSPSFKEEIIFLGKILLLFLLPSIFTFLEPDTGVIFIYFIITISILFTSTIRKRWFLVGITILAILVAGFFYFYFIKQELFIDIFGTDMFYRLDRLFDWKNGTGLQLENSLTAIGSSGWFGHGFNKTPLYFPEAGTDFIFAVFASNFGFFGSIILIIILFLFDFHLLELAIKSKKPIHKFLLVGSVGMIFFQQIQNISMTLGVLPIMGITLPFISYGGSSLLSYLILMGIIFNIYSDEKTEVSLFHNSL